jgi:hypothetical protein
VDRLPRRSFVASALALAGITTVAVSSTADRTLVVSESSSGDRLFELPVEQGDEITIAYTHSVQRTPVEDVYIVDGSTLRADRSVFHSFGAGLPTENVERTDEGYVVEGRTTYDELHVSPGEIAGHELVVGSERYDLVEAADGSVTLSLTERRVRDALAERTTTIKTSETKALNDGQRNE